MRMTCRITISFPFIVIHFGVYDNASNDMRQQPMMMMLYTSFRKMSGGNDNR